MLVLTTGGTIEKSYDEENGSLSNREALIQSAIQRRFRLPYLDLQVERVLNMDSLDMNDTHRDLIFQAIQKAFSLACPIIVTHGTDTMSETAKYCYQHRPSPPVPVVFTGAMGPIGLENSDAYQNMSASIMAAQLAAPGFYICFHGRLFVVPHVRKNREQKTFESAWA